jgi:hypothetical protein
MVSSSNLPERPGARLAGFIAGIFGSFDAGSFMDRDGIRSISLGSSGVFSPLYD